MTVQFTGVALLTALMRAERLRDLDTSWLLFGPSEPPGDIEIEDPVLPTSWKFAAE